MGTSLRIPRVKALIKEFASAVHDRKGYVILVNATDVVTKGWNGVIDYQIEGTCDDDKKQVGKKRKNRVKVETGILKKRKLQHSETEK
ncbi:6623_t:CDS:2 [Dentiscutata heterogama]|uniref:6623_t:CDS:1 n=1 Tax=Dentiscutata heterogama TaxID=1316150 RepID=A0ACA9MX17_9GLOM|nr:6623_t:CDS:2 [Dentiscutata heterogama]